MLAIYGAALAVGGILVGLPAVLGHGGTGHGGLPHGHGGLGHAHGGPGHVHGGGHGANDSHGVAHGPATPAMIESLLWLTLFSLRFWSFAVGFFGLTGVVLDGLKLASNENETLAAALGIGAGSGLLASWLVTRLRNEVLSTVPNEEGFVGLAANVLLEIQPGEPGRISLSARGSLVDLPARSQRGERLVAGTKVVVVEVQQGVASVVAAPAAV